MTAKKPAEQNPISGNPPTLEWISVDQLLVDKEYQRATVGGASSRIIAGMVKGWNWQLCQPLVVSRRDQGQLFVIDGQHRLAGAKQRGDIPHLPCVISTGLTSTAEAGAFVKLNTSRQQLQQSDIFRAMLASGDEKAIMINEMIERCGFTLAPHSVTYRWEPGMLNCAPMLVRQLRTVDSAIIERGLVAMGEAFPDKVVTCAASILKALFLIYRYEGTDEDFDPDKLIETLGLTEPGAWLDEGKQQRWKNPMFTPIEALSEAIMTEYRANQ